ncbi:hypothetical protein M885DRAFT_532539 [Pelagophyceae sp. CCMP2097]|nr:hypothetical protein M885DRAFT_532539 [Pelagophyceae sp. CCMP2097]
MNIAQLRARYELGTFLGRGAPHEALRPRKTELGTYASVYRARDRATGALVAVKRIAVTSDGRRRNAVREAYVMKQFSEQCQHPNVPRAINGINVAALCCRRSRVTCAFCRCWRRSCLMLLP